MTDSSQSTFFPLVQQRIKIEGGFLIGMDRKKRLYRRIHIPLPQQDLQADLLGVFPFADFAQQTALLPAAA